MITGGKGNDTLNGREGDDTYRFSLGDGIDTINGITQAITQLCLQTLNLPMFNTVLIKQL